MSRNEADRFIDDMLADRPPMSYRADPADTALLRTAVILRGSRPGLDEPDEEFVEQLHRRLAAAAVDEQNASLSLLPTSGRPRRDLHAATFSPSRRARPRGMGRQLAFLGTAAAALALVVGAIATTNAVGHHSPGPVVGPGGTAIRIRSAELLAANGRSLGRMDAYNGESSWVFLNMHTTALAGVYTCELQLTNGSTVRVGTFGFHKGSGMIVHLVRVDLAQLQAVRIVTPTGSPVATATFS